MKRSVDTSKVPMGGPASVALARSRRASIFVWSTWALMTVAAVGFVWAFGSNVPLWDEWWGMVPMLSGAEPDTLRWLWRVHNNHRVPLARLLQWFLHIVSGYDFRSGMFFSVAAASVMAGAMMWIAKRVRGSTSYLDVFFSLILLHWGHSV